MKEHAMEIRTLLIRACASIAMVAVLPVHAQLFRAYVSSVGSDANPCTLAQPCRLLPAALVAVADGGEIWMLDSANYNTAAVSVTKSVTILAIPGAVGSVVATGGGNALDINTAGVKVSLRNLVIMHLTSSSRGISFTQGAQLTLSGCEIVNIEGTALHAAAAASRVSVRDSVLRGTGASAIGVKALGDVQVAVHGAQIAGFLQGIFADSGARVTVSQSMLAGNSTGALAISGGGTTTRLVMAHSTVSGGIEAIRGQTISATDTVSITAKNNSLDHATGAAVSLSHAASSSLEIVLDGNTLAENNVGVEVLAGTPTVYTRDNNAMKFNSPDLSGASLTSLSAQ
jgi:hypothetical protein